MSDKTADCEKINNFFGLVVDTDVPESETKDLVIYRDVVVEVNQRLMWTRDANFFRLKRTRIKAERLVNELDCGGYCDWRLPTEEELLHLCYSRGVIGFKDVQLSSYWTANGDKFVDLCSGRSGYGNEMNYIWPVRDGISKEQREQKHREIIEAERLERQRQENIRLEKIEAERQQILKLEKLQLERLKIKT